VGRGSGIAVDIQGDPHISYIDSTNYALKYAKASGGSWDIETVYGPVGDPVSGTSIALGPDGYPRIAFDQGSEDYVRYACRDEGSWNIETVWNGGEGVYLALDSTNIPHMSFIAEAGGVMRPHVAYNDFTLGRVMYAVPVGGSWYSEVVKKLGKPAIAVDRAGRPYIAHQYTDESEFEFGVLKTSYRP